MPPKTKIEADGKRATLARAGAEGAKALRGAALEDAYGSITASLKAGSLKAAPAESEASEDSEGEE